MVDRNVLYDQNCKWNQNRLSSNQKDKCEQNLAIEFRLFEKREIKQIIVNKP